MAGSASPSDVTAGVALGLLTGFIVALASQGAVGAVVTGLVALLAAFFGLAKDIRIVDTSPVRIIAFSAAALFALAVGLLVRTHDMFSPSPRTAIEKLENGLFTRKDERSWEMSRDIYLFQQFGLVPPGRTAAAAPRPSPSSSLLFAGPSPEQCDRTSPAAVEGATALRSLFAAEGGGFKDLADSVASLADDAQVRILSAARRVACSR